MQGEQSIFDIKLNGLDWAAWCAALEEADPEEGFVEPLGAAHRAIFLEDKPVLLVSFESHAQVQALSAQAQPMGWQMAKALGWSHLALVSEEQSWFRERRVIGFFDRLIDDGFFEDFDQVIFYGCGAAGYAACAFSVAAPGAQVLALQPQATLDPRLTEWDDRFRHMRRTDFTARFGYAPDMLDAAAGAWVFYDPEVEMDAVHAALFHRPNVALVKTRHLGDALEAAFARMNVLYRMLAQISAGKLTALSIARLLRARRDDAGYQFGLLQHLKGAGRHRLVQYLCNVVLEKRRARPFRLAQAEAEAALSAAEAEAAAGEAAEESAAEIAAEAEVTASKITG